jgi:hypothetical protein
MKRSRMKAQKPETGNLDDIEAILPQLLLSFGRNGIQIYFLGPVDTFICRHDKASS